MARIALALPIHRQYLGLMHLSSLMKREGHEVRAFVAMTPGDLREIRDWHPDIVGLSAQSGETPWVASTAARLEKLLPREVFVILGGMLPTFEPDTVGLSGLDAICRGEGEMPFLELVQALEGAGEPTGIANLWIKRPSGRIDRNELRPPNPDLDSLPFPDRELFRRYSSIYHNPDWRIWPSRGCPHNCSYCFHHAYRDLLPKSPYLRFRSVDNIIGELREIQENHNPPSIWVGGDTFFVDDDWSFELLRRYGEEIRLPFHLNLRIERLDERKVRALADTGRCHSVTFGLETGDEQLRRETLRRDITDDQVRRGIGLLREAGIPFSTTCMMGLPGETFELSCRTVELNAELRPDSTVCSMYQPLPGTDLARCADEDGIIDDPVASGQMHFFSYGGATIDSEDRVRIERLHKLFYVGTYYPETMPLLRRISAMPIRVGFGIPLFSLMYIRHHAMPLYGSREKALLVLLSGIRDQARTAYNDLLEKLQ